MSKPAGKVSTSAKAPKNIRVFLRIRPMVGREIRDKHTTDNLQVDPSDPTRVTIQKKADKGVPPKNFNFNRVFPPNSAQEDVYNEFARGAVDAAFEGQHGVLFVYGQTGSGKTFTISNDTPGQLGVLQQAMLETWSRIQNDRENDYSCSLSYVQLYNEILTDLLDPKKDRVRLQLGSEGRGDVVLVNDNTGLPIERAVANYNETMEMFRQGLERKEMASTEMNATSSRSHTIFTFHIHRSTRVKAVTANKDEVAAAAAASSGSGGGAASIALEGRIVLCDLAGSERVAKTGAAGKTLDEATHINVSLLVLGKVVAALTDKKSQHAPFRESKLTRILEYSLKGNGNTSLVVNVSPSDDNTDETHSAILFGQRAIQIKQEAKRHEVLDYKALYLQLQADLDAKRDAALVQALNDEKQVYEDRIQALTEQLASVTQEKDLLLMELTSMRSNGGGGGGGGLRNNQPPLSPSSVEAAAASVVAGGAANATVPASHASVAAAAAGGGPAPSPQGLAALQTHQWSAVVDALRKNLSDRDSKLAVMQDERLRLGAMLAEEKQLVLQLAHKLRGMVMRYEVERQDWAARVDELQLQLATSRGTDYLTTGAGGGSGGGGATSSSSSTVGGGDEAIVSPASARGGAAGFGGGGEDDGLLAMLQKRMELAYTAIAALRDERINNLAYQNKARDAIHLLYAEKTHAEQRAAALEQQLAALRK